MRELVDANGSAKTFTYQARVKEADAMLDSFLQDYAALYGLVERKLYADYARGKNISKLKNDYLLMYGITARQFNALSIGLQGKLNSIRALQVNYIEDVKARIKKVSLDIKKLQAKDNLSNKLRWKLHQKKRFLVRLNFKLQRLEKDRKNNKVRLCFGSKKLFKQQFNLQANNLADHAQWLSTWRAARCSQFFIIGSKEESMGNQSCIATINADQSFTLRIRVPTALIPKYGKYIIVNNLAYAYGQHEIAEALANNMQRNIYSRKAQNAITPGLYKQFGQAINYRFLKDAKGWRVFITCDKQARNLISNYKLGTIGVDINVDHLAVTEIDSNGNLQNSFKISTCTYGKSTNQTKAIIGDAATILIAYAVTKSKPLVIEQLDFARKKQDLAFNPNKKYNRLLSSFTYSAMINSIKAKAFKQAIAVYQVNPAYTSVIGRVKFARIYKISVHQAAAMVIARRILGFSEHLPHRWNNIPNDTGGRFTLPQLVKIKGRHVWYTWAKVRKNLQAVLSAQFQTPKHDTELIALAGHLAF